MKKIYIIINPAAGSDAPILSVLHNKLKKHRITCEILVTQKAHDISRFTRRGLKAGVDAVAVCGGDGSIMEAAKILYKTETPLIILPGGTANILVKELGIPTTLSKAIDLIFSRTKKIKKIDVALCNNKPFFLRVSIGVFADMVLDTDPTLKKYLGQLAYPITAVKSLTQAEEIDYRIKIDDTFIRESGVSLIVANSLNLGFQGLSLLPQATVTDSTLYVVLIKNKLSIKEALNYWQGKEVTVSLHNGQQQIIRDDDMIQAKRLHFRIAEEKLHVLVP